MSDLLLGARLVGNCPMGCGQTLFVGKGGHITCSYLPCPRPTAVDELLDDREKEHVVDIGETEFTVRHPLRERLDDELMRCELHRWIAGQSGPPYAVGRYRVPWRGDPDVSWQRLETGRG